MIKEKNLPNGWAIKPMTEVVTWGSGGTPKATESQYYDNGDIPWLIIGDLNDGVVTESQSKITELGLKNSSAKMIPAGTLLVAMYGSIGKLGITGIECCTNQAIAFAKELRGVSTKYMFYYMAMMKSKLISMGKGGTQNNISQTILKSLNVIVPPPEVQDNLVFRIEELFSELDKAVETLQTTKQQLTVYRQAVLYNAFVGLTQAVPMGDIASMTDPQPSHRTPPEVIGGIPYIGVGDIDYSKKQIKLDEARKVSPSVLEEHLARYTLQDGDLIMGKIGTIGKPYKVHPPQNYALSANVILIQPDTKKIDPDFLFWQFSSPIVTKQLTEGATATSQPAFGITKARLLSIRLCEMKQQKEIVQEIESRLSVCKSIEQIVDTALAQADAMRQSMLKQAFEGGYV